MALEKVNKREKLILFTDHWSPKILGELNGQQVKPVKLRGEFVWPHHEDEDEMFLVNKGTSKMEFRDRTEDIGEEHRQCRERADKKRA